jgi:hypothetical protein
VFEEFSVFCSKKGILDVLGYLVVVDENPVVRNDEVYQFTIHPIYAADRFILQALEDFHGRDIPHNIEIETDGKECD